AFADIPLRIGETAPRIDRVSPRQLVHDANGTLTVSGDLLDDASGNPPVLQLWCIVDGFLTEPTTVVQSYSAGEVVVTVEETGTPAAVCFPYLVRPDGMEALGLSHPVRLVAPSEELPPFT